MKNSSGDYARAVAAGVDVRELLVETFGGLGSGLRALLKRAADDRANRLTAGEYDETTWAARNWLTFARQRISVAAHRAVSFD